MAPKKSKGRNAFYYFMVDMKDKQGKDATLAEVSITAGPIWANMNAEQRRPFTSRANSFKKGDTTYKMTSLQENVEYILQTENDLKHQESMMKTDITNIVRRAVNSNQINYDYFHILHLNNFCYATSTNCNYPAEVALLRFNLNDGVLKENIFHKIIKPGKLPMGYSFKARQTSDETHKIQAPMLSSENNMAEITQMIVDFMQVNSDPVTKVLPPIFVDENIINFVRQVFDMWCSDYEYQRDLFKIYSLQYLFYILRNSLSDEAVWPSVSMSLIELQRDVYDFTPGISCDFHEVSDVVIYCSQSIVTRLVFIICDNCCPVAGIELIPGRHVPMRSVVASYDGSCRSISSFYSASGPPSRSGSKMTPSLAGSEYSCRTNTSIDFDNTSDISSFDGDWVQAKNKQRQRLDTATSIDSTSTVTRPIAVNDENVPPIRAPLRRPATMSAAQSGFHAAPGSASRGLGQGRGRAVYQQMPN